VHWTLNCFVPDLFKLKVKAYDCVIGLLWWNDTMMCKTDSTVIVIDRRKKDKKEEGIEEWNERIFEGKTISSLKICRFFFFGLNIKRLRRAPLSYMIRTFCICYQLHDQLTKVVFYWDQPFLVGWVAVRISRFLLGKAVFGWICRSTISTDLKPGWNVSKSICVIISRDM